VNTLEREGFRSGGLPPGLLPSPTYACKEVVAIKTKGASTSAGGAPSLLRSPRRRGDPSFVPLAPEAGRQVIHEASDWGSASPPGELTAELLHSLDRQVQELEATTLVSDLQAAILSLPKHDGVLGEGLFPLSPNSRWGVGEGEGIRQEAPCRGRHFVLSSASARALDYANERPPPRQACRR
jgi:hypothetical protein